jgi:hypothetical protein
MESLEAPLAEHEQNGQNGIRKLSFSLHRVILKRRLRHAFCMETLAAPLAEHEQNSIFHR